MWNESTATQGSLAGVRVIDASRVLGGPFAGQVLADHGADVIKVEPPDGDGQFVDSTLYDIGASPLHPHLANFHLSGKTPLRAGNRHPNICPCDVFGTHTTPLFLAVGNNRHFSTLCLLPGQEDLASDSRFATNSERNQNRDALRVELVKLLSSRDGGVIARKLIEAGVPCAPVQTIDQVLADPHTRHRGMIVDLDGYRGTGSPIKLSRTSAQYRRSPPLLPSTQTKYCASTGLIPRPTPTCCPDLADPEFKTNVRACRPDVSQGNQL